MAGHMEGEPALRVVSSCELRCICYGKSVVRSDARRRVGGPSSKRLIPVFLDFFQTVFPGSTFLPKGFNENSKVFWCKGCFAKLEKVLKLREDTKKLNEEIVGYIKSVGAQFITEARPASTEATVSPSTPRRKRQLSAVNVGAPSPKRRRCYEHPNNRYYRERL